MATSSLAAKIKNIDGAKSIKGILKKNSVTEVEYSNVSSQSANKDAEDVKTYELSSKASQPDKESNTAKVPLATKASHTANDHTSTVDYVIVESHTDGVLVDNMGLNDITNVPTSKNSYADMVLG
ncbi:hypothetical protein QVD17_00113 [Tagetes erecta]|uniref:Uncharacterized protein n=1 Tax=Tagetes erecta TaxID=13708 RepID=A0AAD8P6P7_TARER|nr:hypothetical protein QVD17_00113 [Tagetes erecta]